MRVLPGLRILNIMPPEEECDFVNFVDNLDVLQPVQSLPIGVQSLRHITCEFEIDYGRLSDDFQFRVLNLPNIRSIDIPLRYGIYMDPELTTLPAGLTSGVKN